MDTVRREFLKTGLMGACGLGVLPALAATAAKQPPPDVNKLLAARVTLMPRSAWAPEPPLPQRLRPAGKFNRLTIHHSGAKPNHHTDRNKVTFDIQGVHDTHRKRHYGDIGYHYIIDYAGRVWEGRGLAFEGAHVVHQNGGNIGVMVLGNFEQQQPSADQVHAMASVAHVLTTHFRIDKRYVYGHSDLGRSLCPGRHLYAHVSKLKA